jgi:OPA family glycerol-3-phosphate transporter-like MFS transporter
MIQLGQMAISKLGPYMLTSGIIVFGIVMAKQGEWRALFQIPPLFTAAAAILIFFVVKESPEDAGYPANVVVDEIDDSAGVTVPLIKSLKTILTHPLVWFYALAYACTGAVRQPTDQLAILYFEDQLGFDMKSNIPSIASWTLVLMPLVAFLGSLASGFVSDKFAAGKRAPIAMCLYFFEALVISTAAIILANGLVGPTPSGIWIGCIILVLISMTVNSTHSLVGAAAPMDIGGKKMAGFATGLIDSFQYYGAALSLFITGRVLKATQAEHGYLYWYVIMACFGVLGGLAMLALVIRQRRIAARGLVISG